MATYKCEILQSDKVYKPKKSHGVYNNYWITKFLVLENNASGTVKLWTNGVDVNDDSACVEIPASALKVGTEYDLTVGKIKFSGNLKLLGYQTDRMPLDYPINDMK